MSWSCGTYIGGVGVVSLTPGGMVMRSEWVVLPDFWKMSANDYVLGEIWKQSLVRAILC